MNRRLLRGCLLLIGLFLLEWQTPAPLIYRPGEGWYYEPVGGGKWIRTRAKDQLQVAEKAFAQKDYSTALKASRRTVRTWPFSDYAPRAQYLMARCYEEKGQDERAFKAYQTLLQKYPAAQNFQEVMQRQFAIANRFLAGEWFKLWGVIPFFPSMDKTVKMYENLVKDGPYSPVGIASQLKIGAAREKQHDYPEAVKAYEKASDRYHDQPDIAADALFREALAYQRESKKAGYDQSVAGKAIDRFGDFIALYPNDKRTAEAHNRIDALRTEQALGSFDIAKFYEKKKAWNGALVYYNDVLVRDPQSRYAAQARRRIDELEKRRNAHPDQHAQK